jgi:hypothetical protein
VVVLHLATSIKEDRRFCYGVDVRLWSVLCWVRAKKEKRRLCCSACLASEHDEKRKNEEQTYAPMKATAILSLFAAAACAPVATAFTTAPTQNQRCENGARIQSTHLHLFGDAFKNDDSLGKPKNAGLTNGPKVSEVTVNGKPVKAVAGQKVSQVMAGARVKMTYSCQKGNCGTCEMVSVGFQNNTKINVSNILLFSNYALIPAAYEWTS